MEGGVSTAAAPAPPRQEPSYWLTRFVILRLLGLMYLVAFLVAAQQNRALIGEHGLLPVDLFLKRVEAASGSRLAAFGELPSVFWLDCGDGFLAAAAWLGAELSLIVLAGFANAILLHFA